MQFKDDEFKRFQTFIYQLLGIHLNDRKKLMVENRLRSILAKGKYTSLDHYMDFLKKDKNGDALSVLANKITTNHTYFYREKNHFEYLAKAVLPELKARHSEDRDIRIWCAGCSSGEEAYTIMATIMSFFEDSYKSWNIGLLATDISQNALDKAHRGEYYTQEIKKLPTVFWQYFNQEGELSIVSEELKNEISFRRFNLMNKEYPFKKAFDCIFCRNVMIYFDDKSQNQVIDNLYNNLADLGYLFIGHSEVIQAIEGRQLVHKCSAVYQKQSELQRID